jgi:stage II sporulation protein D
MKKRAEPVISIGIFSGKKIFFSLNGKFGSDTEGRVSEGEYRAWISDERILVQSLMTGAETEGEIFYTPLDNSANSFTLKAVTIGVNFHWQRNEDQVFRGSLKIIKEDGKLTAVNIISIEEYLKSVISSEMRATSSTELLKAHSVVSRSWLLAQLDKSKESGTDKPEFNSNQRSDDEILRWYDREDHTLYDVCADDHCQRYQGITRASSEVVEKAIRETFGEVMTFNNKICDTRYYKCCGGATERFENVWEPVNHPYLQKVVDSEKPGDTSVLNLENEAQAVEWIKGNPNSFCNSSDKKILSEVLNDYDQETNDFFRWNVSYSQDELSSLIKTRTGIDFGKISDLIPLKRGVSGRVLRLKIIGSKKTLIIGKELEIRKALSKTHLYSSCFYVEKASMNGELSFILHGAGWGHGVGLCQIGAAVMGAKGYKYEEILSHYFKGARLERLY